MGAAPEPQSTEHRDVPHVGHDVKFGRRRASWLRSKANQSSIDRHKGCTSGEAPYAVRILSADRPAAAEERSRLMPDQRWRRRSDVAHAP